MQLPDSQDGRGREPADAPGEDFRVERRVVDRDLAVGSDDGRPGRVDLAEFHFKPCAAKVVDVQVVEPA